MKLVSKIEMDTALAWCASVLGPCEAVSDNRKFTVATSRPPAASVLCYLKVHQSRSHWQNEVHAYERGAGVFGQD